METKHEQRIMSGKRGKKLQAENNKGNKRTEMGKHAPYYDL